MWESGAFGRLSVLAGLSFVLVAGVPIEAQPPEASWRSSLFGRDLLLVEKVPVGHPGPPRPLPPSVSATLGPDTVDYESFVATRIPPDAAGALIQAAAGEGLFIVRQPERPVSLPHHVFEPLEEARRSEAWAGRSLQPRPVQGLFLVRFAYPIRVEWVQDLAACHVEKVVYLGNGDYLMRASNLGAIRSCSVSRYLLWAGPFLSTDRLSPGLLDEIGEEFRKLVLQFKPGTSLEEALNELPSAVQVLSSYRPPDRQPEDSLFLHVLAGAPEVEALARVSERLLAVLPEAEAELSDERQGQIVAGNHAGTTVPSTGYLAWLNNRLLNDDANQQTVAVFDTGYDDGTGPAGAHHPDLENPERLVDGWNFVDGAAVTEDTRGHGTVVAGIVSGNGTGTNAKDSQNFLYGMGIAPKAKIVAVQVFDSFPANCVLQSALSTNQLEEEFRFARTTTSNLDKALIANHSWNSNKSYYNDTAQLFDQKVLDADAVRTGLQPMTIVVAAGNRVATDPLDDSLQTPAVAKNVIAVGSTQSYRPSTQAGAPPLSCDSGTIGGTTEEANNIALVSTFSRRGRSFEPYPGTSLFQVRVKPDLVAPGGRVFSTVPFSTPGTYICPRLCYAFWPSGGSHSFSQGTSFATPVVSGVAALARKWFLDRSANASPSLIKAALIATADDLGQYFSQPTDHRPSNDFGWGRVNLGRLTDSAARFYVTDNQGLAVATGGARSWTRTIDDTSKPTYIVLVWSDPASATVQAGTQAPLVNDLQLAVDRVGIGSGWRGNSFNEAITGVDDGYSYTYTFGVNLNDTANNVEAVFLPPNTFSAGQQITISVTGVNVPTGTQKYAIYGYNVRLGS